MEPAFLFNSERFTGSVPYLLNASINVLWFVFSAGINVLFGYFPARRAAQMDPFEALRHE